MIQLANLIKISDKIRIFALRKIAYRVPDSDRLTGAGA